MDRRRLLGAADSRGPKLTNKNPSETPAAPPGEAAALGSGATEDPAGSSWTVAAGKAQVTTEWGSRAGGWVSAWVRGTWHNSLQGWRCPAGLWAGGFSPLAPWLPEHCRGRRRWSAIRGLSVQGRWPGVLQVAQVPSLHRGLKQGWPAGYGECRDLRGQQPHSGSLLCLWSSGHSLWGLMAESPPPHALLALKVKSSLPRFWNGVPKPSLNVCLFLLVGQPGDSGGDGRRAGG